VAPWIKGKQGSGSALHPVPHRSFTLNCKEVQSKALASEVFENMDLLRRSKMQTIAEPEKSSITPGVGRLTDCHAAPFLDRLKP